jgi:hypothetical protein
LTPPPTNAEPPRRESVFAVLRQKAIEAYYQVEDVLPRLRNGDAWLRILRLPNLLTVPGDVFAGFLLAPAAGGGDWAQLLLAVPAGLLLTPPDSSSTTSSTTPKISASAPTARCPPTGFRAKPPPRRARLLLDRRVPRAFFDALPVAPRSSSASSSTTSASSAARGSARAHGACRAGNLLLGAAPPPTACPPRPPLDRAAVLGCTSPPSPGSPATKHPRSEIPAGTHRGCWDC